MKLKSGDFKGTEQSTYRDTNWQQTTLPYAYNPKETFKEEITDFTTGYPYLVHWMHVAPWKQNVESCDRLRVIQAMPAAEKDSKGNQWKQRVARIRDAIIYNKNNPSISFYECEDDAINEELMFNMQSLLDTYPPRKQSHTSMRNARKQSSQIRWRNVEYLQKSRQSSG
ncbi:hypothetical protein [Formosa sp. 4Alg 33]|uniref:hypothetical protein n=1 Tax=Formosa sp. 4Alg 33 TaxID=3382189 RepID=UPI003D9C48C2